MWTCHNCGKPVYFAERRQSLGFDWHPYCLRCEECGKVLNPGQHAEHKSVPYCHIPCYAALFGPKLFGHGSTTESHRSFGNRSKSFIRLETELNNKVREYNRYHSETPRCQLLSREVNERLIFEGVLKIYWGTECSIRLKEYDDNRVIKRHKKTLSLGFEYANIKYDEANNRDEDTSLDFPPQLGDLSLMFPPELGNLTPKGKKSDLHKWETLTKLDKESDETLDVQLLESLIDEKSLKPLSRAQQLQRSQSVRVDPSHKPSLVRLDDSMPIQPLDSQNDVNDNLSEPISSDATCDITATDNLTNHAPTEINGNLTDEVINLVNGILDEEAAIRPDTLDIEDIENKENVEEPGSIAKPTIKLGVYKSRKPPVIKTSPMKPSNDTKSFEETTILHESGNDKCEEEEVVRRSKGPRALRRRRGKMTRLRRRSSINGHWYDRETAVFTPPKHSAMSVWTSSLSPTSEVISALLSKYKIESEAADFGIYVVKESGETRLITETEFPLLLRVNLGPHDDIAKIYLMNKEKTNEISHKVAQFLKFSYTELRSFLSMFYEEEEREADRIRYKYHVMREVMVKRLQELEQQDLGI